MDRLAMTCDLLGATSWGPGRSEGTPAEVGSFPHPRSFHHLILLCAQVPHPKGHSTSSSRDSVVRSSPSIKEPASPPAGLGRRDARL